MGNVKFYVGTVRYDDKDKGPKNLNRVRVNLNTGEKEPDTDWLRCITRLAGNGAGLNSVPNNGDEVLVLETESHERIVLGRLWNDNQTPPSIDGSNKAGESNEGTDKKSSLNFIKTKSGNMVIFDDTNGDEKIRIIASKEAAKIELLAKEKKIVLKGENILIKAAKGMELKANTISLNADGGTIDIESKNLTLSAADEAKITATGDLTLKGNSIGLN